MCESYYDQFGCNFISVMQTNLYGPGNNFDLDNAHVLRSEFLQSGSVFYSNILVKKSASIGANATIVCGVTIGEYALIGSSAVITKDVQPNALVVGNPERLIGIVNKEGNRCNSHDHHCRQGVDLETHCGTEMSG